MATVIGIAGSLRQASYNAALLRAAVEVAPPDLRIDTASIAGIPVYDGDLETSAFPEVVSDLKARIAAADGLLLVTPEYNASIPGAFKNAFDWLSRPPKDIARVFGDKPVALIGASTSLGGTRFAQAAWLPVLRHVGTRLWTGKQFYLASAAHAFDAEGRLADEKTRGILRELLAGFAKSLGA